MIVLKAPFESQAEALARLPLPERRAALEHIARTWGQDTADALKWEVYRMSERREGEKR